MPKRKILSTVYVKLSAQITLAAPSTGPREVPVKNTVSAEYYTHARLATQQDEGKVFLHISMLADIKLDNKPKRLQRTKTIMLRPWG